MRPWRRCLQNRLKVITMQILEMNIALLLVETDQAILFQRSDKEFYNPMNVFHISDEAYPLSNRMVCA